MAASSHCVIVGRAADVILSDFHPFKIFVYADMDYRVSRCQGNAETEEQRSPRELEKSIRSFPFGPLCATLVPAADIMQRI